MYSAEAVANFFIGKGLEEGRPITPMQLQKLIYFAHGWHLAVYGSPLINEKVEAWPYGPVVPSIYHAVKRNGAARIESLITTLNRQGTAIETPMVSGPRTLALLERIWDVYGHYSAVQLSRMSHDPKGPWHKTWNDEAKRGEIRGVDIPDAEMKRYFIESARQNRTTTTAA
jgi:uncharacterized phage-associated protein